jgi:hypothetical protein
MVGGHELRYRATKMPLPRQDHAVEALLLDRPHQPLRIRVAVGCSERRRNDPDSRLFEELQHGTTPFTVTIADHYATTRQYAVNRIRQVTHGLSDEGFARVPSGAGHVDSPRVQLNHEDRVIRHQSTSGPTSVVKESAATRAGEWARRNVRQDVGRSPLGGMPSAFRKPAIVERATRRPTFFSAL